MDDIGWCHGMYGELKELVLDEATALCRNQMCVVGHQPSREALQYWSEPLTDNSITADESTTTNAANENVSALANYELQDCRFLTTATAPTSTTTSTTLSTSREDSCRRHYHPSDDHRNNNDYSNGRHCNQINDYDSLWCSKTANVLSPSVPTDTDVLTFEIMSRLQNYMPLAKRGESFWLKYSLVRDGASLDTMLNKIQNVDCTIMAIETVDGEVFGCYCGEAWHRSSDFYGTGESFLWKCRSTRKKGYDYSSALLSSSHHQDNSMIEDARDEEATDDDDDDDDEEVSTTDESSFGADDVSPTSSSPPVSSSPNGGTGLKSLFVNDDNNNTNTICFQKKKTKKKKSDLQVYPFSFLNHNIQLCQHDRLIVGGGFRRGDPRWGFGLCLDPDLLRGSSSPCLTFSSPSLSTLHSDGSAFEIRNLEVWTLTPCLSLEEAECQLRKRLQLSGMLHTTGSLVGSSASTYNISRASSFNSGRRSNSSRTRW